MDGRLKYGMRNGRVKSQEFIEMRSRPLSIYSTCIIYVYIHSIRHIQIQTSEPHSAHLPLTSSSNARPQGRKRLNGDGDADRSL